MRRVYGVPSDRAVGKFEHHGKYFDISAPELDPIKERGLHMKPYQLPHPPISAAATTIRSDSIRNAGVQGWIPMSSPTLSVPNLTGHWEEYEAGATSAGRKVNRSQWRIARDVLVASTALEARERANAVLRSSENGWSPRGSARMRWVGTARCCCA